MQVWNSPEELARQIVGPDAPPEVIAELTDGIIKCLEESERRDPEGAAVNMRVIFPDGHVDVEVKPAMAMSPGPWYRDDT